MTTLMVLEGSSIQLPGISIVLSALVCLIGALVYAFASNPKLAEIGKGLSYFSRK